MIQTLQTAVTAVDLDTGSLVRLWEGTRVRHVSVSEGRLGVFSRYEATVDGTWWRRYLSRGTLTTLVQP